MEVDEMLAMISWREGVVKAWFGRVKAKHQVSRPGAFDSPKPRMVPAKTRPFL